MVTISPVFPRGRMGMPSAFVVATVVALAFDHARAVAATLAALASRNSRRFGPFIPSGLVVWGRMSQSLLIGRRD